MWARLKSRRGETLTEVLVALLVVSLSIVLLTSMVNASMSINARMRRTDSDPEEGFYPALSAAETHEFTDDDTPLAIRVTGGPTPLTLDGVYAYTADGFGGLTVYGKEG